MMSSRCVDVDVSVTHVQYMLINIGSACWGVLEGQGARGRRYEPVCGLYCILCVFLFHFFASLSLLALLNHDGVLYTVLSSLLVLFSVLCGCSFA